LDFAGCLPCAARLLDFTRFLNLAGLLDNAGRLDGSRRLPRPARLLDFTRFLNRPRRLPITAGRILGGRRRNAGKKNDQCPQNTHDATSIATVNHKIASDRLTSRGAATQKQADGDISWPVVGEHGASVQ
jgi:hypothetical protein